MDPMRIMICTDGSKVAESAAREVILFRFPKDTCVVLLHVIEKNVKPRSLDNIFSPIEALLSPYFPSLERKVVAGSAGARIQAECQKDRYNLIVIGATGTSHRMFHRHIGSTAKKIIRSMDIPLLLVRQNTALLKKALICTGGETLSADTLHNGGFLISFSNAQVNVLHVMSQLALASSPQAEDLVDTTEAAIRRKTWEGIHLTWAVDQIRQAGVSSPITPILRHGLVLDQVIAEIKEGKYDLLVIGSHHVPGRSRALEVFLEDVASDLVSEAPCSVLIV